MATGENVEGENLIAKAGRNGVVRKQRQQSKSRSTSEGGGNGNGAPRAKRAQYCTICKNHNQRVLKKRHKCPHSDCQCPLCQLSKRVQCIMCHQQRLWRFRKSMEKNGSPQNKDASVPIISSPSSSTSSSLAEGDYHLQESAVDDPSPITELAKSTDKMKTDRQGKQQVCDKCRNHNEWVLKRGHKGKCPYENCNCQYCSFTIKRRDLMKHQQRVRRAQVTSQPTNGKQDYILQPSEIPTDQQVSSSLPLDDPAMSPTLLNDNTPQVEPDTIAGQGETRDSTSPSMDIPTGPSPTLAPGNALELHNHNVDQNKSQTSWSSCSNEKSLASKVSRVVSSNNRLPCTIPKEPNIPLVKADVSQEQCVSPTLPQERHFNQVVSPGENYEPSLSPSMSHETRIVSEFSNEQNFLQANCNDSRISPVISNETLISSPLPHEPRIFQERCYESRLSNDVMSHELKTSLTNNHGQRISQMLSEPRTSPENSHDPRFSQTLFHDAKFSQVMSYESRTPSNVFNEPVKECTPFHQQNNMNQGAGYTSMSDETMHSPVNYFKEEPITDDAMFYDNMGTLTPSADFTPDAHDFDTGRNFMNDTEINIMRHTSHPKFGVEPDDLQLRNWSTKRTRLDQLYQETYQGNNFRGSSLCIPLSHTQQHSLPQHSTINQQPYYPVMPATSATTFDTNATAYGWETSGVQPCTATPRSHSAEVIQSRHAIVPMPNCDAFVHSHHNQSQALWWQQARVASLERTNSC